MIIKGFYQKRQDGVNLYRTYSDQNLMIQKVGTDEVYSEAIDVENSGFTYVETDKPVDAEDTEVVDPEEATEADYIAALAELGVEE